jgi:predicted MFS family arabinose efflux permease
MTEGLGISESQVGFLVGVYALASAVCALPLVSATLADNRKKLLLAPLIGFAASNIMLLSPRRKRSALPAAFSAVLPWVP